MPGVWRVLSVWLLLLGCFSSLSFADERLEICHGYGCVAQVDVVYAEAQLEKMRQVLLLAVDADDERSFLAGAMGQLYRWAGQQSIVRNDRGGNYADENVPGRMDCIDHSTSTTRLLRLLEARGYLRWHRVLEPEARHFAGLIAVHWSAVIEETGTEGGERFVVDSWFVDNGEPAVILPLDEWKKGAGPDV